MGRLALIAIALLPSAWLAWQWRAMPQLGLYHDDAIYLVSAKSLAEGNGYRIESLPGAPYQTKYPPLFPALLAAVWKLNPAVFPANLPGFMALSWAGFLLFVFLTWRVLDEAGVSDTERTVLTAFTALSPAAVQFGCLAMSELWFSALLMASLVAAVRLRALTAGALAGLAFLARSAALPLLLTTPLLYLWRRQYRQAIVFFVSMLPAVVGWQWWAAAHRAPASPEMLFYTDYFGFYLRDVSLTGLPALMYENLNTSSKAIGELFIFDPDTGMLALTVARVVTAASVSGCIRLATAGRFCHYGAFAIGYTAELLVWNYPPTQRFFLPVMPLLVAGLWRELSALAATIRKAVAKRGAERAVAFAMCALLGLFGWQSARYSYDAFAVFYPKLFAERAESLSARLAAHRAVMDQPLAARLVSYQDPVDYLYTGRRGFSLRVPPGVLKRGNREEVTGFFAALPDMMASQGAGYVVVTGNDYRMDSPELTLPAYRAIFNGAGFERVWEQGPTAVYRRSGPAGKWAYDRAR